MSTNEPTPRQRISHGLTQSDEKHERAALERTASQHRPEYDDEADRIAKLPTLSPGQRLALGFHQVSRKAAAALRGDGS